MAVDAGATRHLRVLVDFVRTAHITHHSWVFSKRELGGTDQLVAAMSRELGAMIRANSEYFGSWDRIVIYYDNGQRELTNLVNSVFNAHLSTVEVRKVVPSAYKPLSSSRPLLHPGAASPQDRDGRAVQL